MDINEILGLKERKNIRIDIRKDSFTLMRIFDSLGLSAVMRSINIGDAEKVLNSLYTSRIKQSLTINSTLAREIANSLMDGDREKTFDYMKKRPEFAQAIETFIVSVAEKTLENDTIIYSDCWIVLTKVADAVHKYTGVDDPNETGRLIYRLQFPNALKGAREAWQGVPSYIREDMSTLLKAAYGPEGLKYIDGVLKQLSS